MMYKHATPFLFLFHFFYPGDLPRSLATLFISSLYFIDFYPIIFPMDIGIIVECHIKNIFLAIALMEIVGRLGDIPPTFLDAPYDFSCLFLLLVFLYNISLCLPL